MNKFTNVILLFEIQPFLLVYFNSKRTGSGWLIKNMVEMLPFFPFSHRGGAFLSHSILPCLGICGKNGFPLCVNSQ